MLLQRKTGFDFWEEKDIAPFDELILSWNALRPKRGSYCFYVSVRLQEWTSWLFYAEWGSQGQSSALNGTLDGQVGVYQDTLEVFRGLKANGFRIKVLVKGDAAISEMHGLYVYVNDGLSKAQEVALTSSIYLPMQGISQMQLSHVRHKDLCSPTSTAAVICYLLQRSSLSPEAFAPKVWDRGFDIFGNWVLNTAAAFEELGSSWSCWVERLQGFSQIYERLSQGLPTIVSVRGPLAGSALSYLRGHLMAVIGFNHQDRKVICMDPAFGSNQETIVAYDFASFIQAWQKSKLLSYIIVGN